MVPSVSGAPTAVNASLTALMCRAGVGLPNPCIPAVLAWPSLANAGAYLFGTWAVHPCICEAVA